MNVEQNKAVVAKELEVLVSLSYNKCKLSKNNSSDCDLWKKY